MARNPNPITRDIRVGKVSAEEDSDLLFECFVDTEALSDILDMENNASILAGRTGAGKSAIIQYINRNKKSAVIEPGDMAMDYIANSDVIRFLNDIDAPLGILFQTLWKHVLLVEYIKVRYQLGAAGGGQKMFERLIERCRTDIRRKKAKEYIEKYYGSFWVSMDENLKTITSAFEENIEAEIGVDISKFKSRAGYGRNLSRENKQEYIARAKKIINSEQLRELSAVIDLISSDEASGFPTFLLIDRLDTRWVDEQIKYKLINALVESVHKFRPIRSLKIIVALRTDVIEKSMQENEDTGFQREKYQDFITNIRWGQDQLKELINRRIDRSYRRKYSPNKQVYFDDIFPYDLDGGGSYKYIIERTLLRPRDLIAFTNECLNVAESKSEIAPKDIYAAERTYSLQRLSALIDEWRSAYPCIEAALGLLSGRNESFALSSLSEEEIDNLAVKIAGTGRDALAKSADLHVESGSVQTREAFLKELASLLYRTGAVGIKLNANVPVMYSHLGRSTITSSEISMSSSVYVTKMLQVSLNINAKSSDRRRARH